MRPPHATIETPSATVRDRARTIARWLRYLAGAALAFGVLAWLTWPRDPNRNLGSLPPSQRQSLYLRTLENLRTVCVGPAAADVRDFCRAEAVRVVTFPECDDACRALATHLLPAPTR